MVQLRPSKNRFEKSKTLKTQYVGYFKFVFLLYCLISAQSLILADGPAPHYNSFKRICRPKDNVPSVSVTISNKILPTLVTTALSLGKDNIAQLIKTALSQQKIPIDYDYYGIVKNAIGINLVPDVHSIKIGKLKVDEVPVSERTYSGSREYEATVSIEDLHLNLHAEVAPGYNIGSLIKWKYDTKLTDDLQIRLKTDPKKPTEIKIKFLLGDHGQILSFATSPLIPGTRIPSFLPSKAVVKNLNLEFKNLTPTQMSYIPAATVISKIGTTIQNTVGLDHLVQTLVGYQIKQAETNLNKLLLATEVNPDDFIDLRVQSIYSGAGIQRRLKDIRTKVIESQKILEEIYMDANNPKKKGFFQSALQFFKKSKMKLLQRSLNDFRSLASQLVTIANKLPSIASKKNLDVLQGEIAYFVKSINAIRLTGLIGKMEIDLGREVGYLSGLTREINEAFERIDDFLKKKELKNTLSITLKNIQDTNLRMNLYLNRASAPSAKPKKQKKPDKPLPDDTNVQITMNTDAINRLIYQLQLAGGLDLCDLFLGTTMDCFSPKSSWSLSSIIGEKRISFVEPPQILWKPDPSDSTGQTGRHFVRFGKIKVDADGISKYFWPKGLTLPDVYFSFVPCSQGIAQVCLYVEPVRGASIFTKSVIDWGMEAIRQVALDGLQKIAIPRLLLEEQKKNPGFLKPYKIRHTKNRIHVDLN